MPHYEYKIIPAPNRGVKVRGVKGTAARFAHGLEQLMNEVGAEGWQYLRADTLPCEERQGLTGRTTVFQNVLVFQREKQSEVAEVLVPDVAVMAAPEVAAVVDAPRLNGGEVSGEVAKESSGEDTPVLRAEPRVSKPGGESETD